MGAFAAIFTFMRGAKFANILKLLPIIFMVLTVLGGYFWIKNTIKHQKETIDDLNSQIIILQKDNQDIKDANGRLADEMKNVKDLTETYNKRVITIEKNSKTLSNAYNSKSFKELSKKDIPAAEQQFNNMFNDYLKGIQDFTSEQAK